MTKRKLLLVDDHQLILDIFSSFFDAAKNIEVFCVTSKTEAIAALHVDPTFDLVLLDLNLTGHSDVTLVSEFQARFPDVRFAILTGTADEAHAALVMELGAVGFLPKNLKPAALLEAVETLCAGGVFVPSEVYNKIGAPLPERVRKNASTDEVVFMRLLNLGFSNSEIAAKMRMTSSMTDDLRRSVFRHLGVRTRQQAIAMTLAKDTAA